MMKKLKQTLAWAALWLAALTYGLPAAEAAPLCQTLYAGKTTNAGSVCVDNDTEFLTVTYAATGDWWLEDLHLFVGTSLSQMPPLGQRRPRQELPDGLLLCNGTADPQDADPLSRVHARRAPRTRRGQGTAEPLDEVGRRIAQRSRLVCFDEFHVSDIADAMILHRLLAKLFDLRVGFVMTSNYAPQALYPDGLHRDRLLPAIALLQAKLDVVQVDAGVDYRRRVMEHIETYLQPAGPAAERRLEAAFAKVAEADDDDPVPLRRRDDQ